MGLAFAPGAILLDMDGLLIDSEPLWDEVTRGFAHRHGADYDAIDSAACMGRGIGHTVAHLQECYGLAGDAATHINEIIDDFAGRAGSVAACHGADALMDLFVPLVPVALGSSSARRVVEAALSHRGWLPRFRAVVTGTDVVRLKPLPDIYLEAARQLGVPPACCVVLEDSPAGCTAGKAAGMTVIAVSRDGAPTVRSIADFVVHDLFEAAKILTTTVVRQSRSTTGTSRAL